MINGIIVPCRFYHIQSHTPHSTVSQSHDIVHGMKKIFVSGTYDILHGGHLQFFQDARALGDHLTVCFASSEVIKLSKKRISALPDSHKKLLIGSLRFVDKVVSSSDLDPVFDFISHWKTEKPDILVVTEDDRNAEKKRTFCATQGVELIILPKRPPTEDTLEPVSTTSIREKIRNSPAHV